MGTVTQKLQFVFCLTSTAVLFPKIACSQTDGHISELDSVGKSKSPSIPESDITDAIAAIVPDIPAIAEPESFQDVSELGGYKQTSGLNVVYQTRVKDLEAKLSHREACVSDDIGHPEFTKVVDLVAKNRINKPL